MNKSRDIVQRHMARYFNKHPEQLDTLSEELDGILKGFLEKHSKGLNTGKIDLQEELNRELDIFFKGHMDILLENNPEEFKEYASRDSVVTLLYLSAIYDFNSRIPVTINSAAAHVAELSIRKVLDCRDTKDFERKYKGVKKARGGLEFKSHKPHIRQLREHISDAAKLVDYIAADSYHGGYNTCPTVGYYPFLTHDYDIRNAYPTAMVLLRMVVWEDPIAVDLSGRELSLDDFDDPLTPIFAYVEFNFPDDVAFPTIPIESEGSIIYTRTSEGRDGVYAAGPEIYLALKLGAHVRCKRGYKLNVNEKKPLAEIVNQLVHDRAKAADEIVDCLLKTIVNVIYGKSAQNVKPKRSWSPRNDEVEDLKPSDITNPYIASMTTSIIRAILLAAQNEITSEKYKVFSATTDGFISDFPAEKIDELNLYGFAPLIREARVMLTDGDNSIWKEKHTQDDLLNFTTRGNVSLLPGGVCAHNSYITGYTKDEYEDRYSMMTQVLSRTGRIPFIKRVWPSLKDIIHKGSDFQVTEKTERKSMDYDLKRKPVRSSLETVYPVIEGEKYEIANFMTEPFENEAEYLKYRRIAQHTNCLRTKEEWEKFLIRAENDCRTHIRDLEYSRIMSAVMAYRAKKVKIPVLEDMKTKDKLIFINKFNKSDKVFDMTAWKECGKSERIERMLPMSEIEDIIKEMQKGT